MSHVTKLKTPRNNFCSFQNIKLNYYSIAQRYIRLRCEFIFQITLHASLKALVSNGENIIIGRLTIELQMNYKLYVLMMLVDVLVSLET